MMTTDEMILDPLAAARAAAPTRPGRPATAVLHDSPDARIVVFRLGPGQQVPPHRSPSTVLLHVLEGSGAILGPGGDLPAARGELVAFSPHELHGMRAPEDGEMVVMATIAPRPGGR